MENINNNNNENKYINNNHSYNIFNPNFDNNNKNE